MSRTIYRVVWYDYSDSGHDSTWANEADAKARLAELQQGDGLDTYWYKNHGEVEDETVFDSREEFDAEQANPPVSP